MPALAPLPVDEILSRLIAALQGGRNAVVVAPPGAGKTTRVPPALLPVTPLSVVLLQPRRVAARAAAARIGFEQGWRVGEEVGYQIRFENRTGPRTRIRVVTEGILTRVLQSDPFLEGIGCVILDEFHERSIHTDLALALLREVQETVRPDLRIVVMSATMDPGPVAAFLGDAPVIESRGRLYPVEVRHLARSNGAPVWQLAADTVRTLLTTAVDPSNFSSHDGHILVFLPGIGEIRRAERLLDGIDAEIHILHSSVAAEDQDRALRPSARRKVILATNIAETSLTIDGVRTVVDGGLARVALSDPRLGIDRLELRRISLASARQRAGRAGRTGPGVCLRLWTLADETGMAAADLPEVQRIDLAPTLLALRDFGAADPARFRWFEPPRPDALAAADALLRMLGAVDGRGALTAVGRRLARLPIHPRLGRLVLAGVEAGVARDAATLAALLSEGDILAAPHATRRGEARWEADSDVLERLEAVETGGASAGFDTQALVAVRRERDELGRLERQLGKPSRPAPADAAARHEALLRVLLHAYPDRVTVRRSGGAPGGGSEVHGLMVGGRGVVLDPASVVRRALLFLSLDPREAAPPPQSPLPAVASAERRHAGARLGRGGPRPADRPDVAAYGAEARVALVSAVREEWLGEIFPHLVERRLDHRYDSGKERVVAVRRTLFAGLAVREVPAEVDRDRAGDVLRDHLLPQAAEFVARDEAASRWLARVAFLRRHMPELALPDPAADLLAAALGRACAGRARADDALWHSLRRHLEQSLDTRQQAALAREAPEAIAVPSGSRIRLVYPPGGGAPALPVRIQEVFGLADTPRLAAGRVPVVMQLLGPNHRPVQNTSDLRSFWSGAYGEVRRELRARYPRHPWPEDPWNAPPVAVGRRGRSK